VLDKQSRQGKYSAFGKSISGYAVEARMARHNREARGTDQRGFDYEVSYQPDWLQVVKVTRNLESGRQSTKTLFRNPEWREQPPGQKVRTRIVSAQQGLNFEITVNDPRGVVKRVIVETALPAEEGKAAGTEEVARVKETIRFTIEDELPPPPPPPFKP
jgi:hypothetical protein